MEYKIWIATYFNSPPPYPIELPAEEIERNACIWKTEETIWRHDRVLRLLCAGEEKQVWETQHLMLH